MASFYQLMGVTFLLHSPGWESSDTTDTTRLSLGADVI